MSSSGIKSLVKDTAIYGLSSIVGRFLNWSFFAALHTRVLVESEYGIVNNIYAYVALILVILTFGMETSFFRFVNKKESEAYTVYSTVLIFVASLSSLFVFICLLFIDPISNFLEYQNHQEFIVITAIVVAFDAFTAIPFAFLRYKKRPIKFATLKLLHIVLCIFFNIFFLIICPWVYENNPELISWFYKPDYGVSYIFISNLIPSILLAIILIPEYTGFKYRFDKVLFKSMLKYSYPLVILGITGVMNQIVDKILYPLIFDNPHEGNTQLGIYSAATKIAIVMVMFTQAFRFAYEPFIFAQNKGEEDKQMYSKVMTYFVLFALVIFLGVTYYLDIIKYLIGSNYHEGLIVIPIVMIGELFLGVYFNLSLWFKLTDKTMYGAYISTVGCIIIVAINVIFVPIYGFIASAWATLICYFTMSALSYFYGQKYYPVNYQVKKLFIYLSVALVFYFIGTLPNIENEILRLTYRTILLILFLAIIIKKEIPLTEIPFINKLYKKHNN